MSHLVLLHEKRSRTILNLQCQAINLASNFQALVEVSPYALLLKFGPQMLYEKEGDAAHNNARRHHNAKVNIIDFAFVLYEAVE